MLPLKGENSGLSGFVKFLSAECGAGCYPDKEELRPSPLCLRDSQLDWAAGGCADRVKRLEKFGPAGVVQWLNIDV